MTKFDSKTSDGRILCEVQKGDTGIDPAGMSEKEKDRTRVEVLVDAD
jgi:hypothetical protein